MGGIYGKGESLMSPTMKGFILSFVGGGFIGVTSARLFPSDLVYSLLFTFSITTIYVIAVVPRLVKT